MERRGGGMPDILCKGEGVGRGDGERLGGRAVSSVSAELSDALPCDSNDSARWLGGRRRDIDGPSGGTGIISGVYEETEDLSE